MLPADDQEQAVEALLSQRAHALRTRDEAAFLASVDPKAPAGFRKRQHDLFRNMAEVPLAEWSYETDSTDTLLPPPPAEPADEIWAPEVTLRYALAGVDEVPTERSLGYSFTRRGDSWYLAGDQNLAGQGRSSWQGPWDFERCRVITTETGLIIGHAGNRALAGRVAGALDSSVAAVTQVWGPDWAQRVGVLLPGSRDELRALVGTDFAVDSIAAVAVADRVDTTERRVEGPRVVLNAETAGRLSDPALRVVLQHEITHIAARADTVDGAPMWMLEGFADYVGYRGSRIEPAEIAPELAKQVHRGKAPTRLPQDRDFQSSGRRLDLAYQQAWSWVDFLVGRLGEQRVVELYHRVAGSSASSTAEAALREMAGVDTTRLIAEWGVHLRRTLG